MNDRTIRLPAKETQALAEICYNLRSQGADFTAELVNDTWIITLR